MNLRTDPWILIKDADGTKRHVTLSEVRNLSPLVIAYPRDDINFAVLMAIIALENNPEQDIDYLDTVAADGAKQFPASRLLIDSPGEQTLKLNKDFFVKREVAQEMAFCAGCYPGVAYAYSQLAGGGGKGYLSGASCNRCLYIVSADTVRELVERNKVPPQPDSPLFFAPSLMRPVDPVECHCYSCGQLTRCYSGVLIKPQKYPDRTATPHPHACAGPLGNEFSFNGWKTETHAILQLADRKNSVPPQAVALHAAVGDTILFLGLENPQGKVKNLLFAELKMPRILNGYLAFLQRAAAEIFRVRATKGSRFTNEQAGEIYGELSHLMTDQGLSVYQAALRVLNSGIPLNPPPWFFKHKMEKHTLTRQSFYTSIAIEKQAGFLTQSPWGSWRLDIAGSGSFQ